MTFIKTWDETVPAGSRAVNLGDNDIRDFKYAVRERLNVDHNFKASEGADANIGRHNSATLIDQGVDLVAVSGAFTLYSKTISGAVELFAVMADSTVMQITTAGKLNGALLSGVDGALLSGLANITAGAGEIPSANINDTNTAIAANQVVALDGDGKLPAVPGDLLTGLTLSQLSDVGVYDSGWFAVTKSKTYTKTHNLGTTKVLTQLLFATDDAGSNTDIVVSGFVVTDDGGYGAIMTALTTTTIKIHAANKYINNRGNDGNFGEAPLPTRYASGYYKLIMVAIP